MASFTSQPSSFNPYISQLPIVEEMSKVGMEKQAKYDQGLQKIQTQIDNVAGMDIIRDVDKKYLQSKMGELGNNLKYVAAGDFSNYQLVNSIGGMVNQVGKDENVQNAVYSTMKYKKGAADMAAANKAGKGSPDNDYLFNKQVSAWLNSSDIKTSFNASYTPYFDVFKFAKETFDEILPDGMSFDQIYQLGADGKPITDKNGNLIYSPTMTRMEKEGRMPEKVQQTIAQIFSDPRVNQQLNITGQYNYRGLTPEQLSEKIGDQKEQILTNYKSKLDELTIQKSIGKNVQKEIDELQSRMTTISLNYENYAKSAHDNPDAVRGMLYSDDVSSRYTTMFGQIKTKEQIMENPGWRSQFDMQKEANIQSRWSQEFAQRKLEHRDDQEYRKATLKQEADIAAGKLGLGDKSNFEQGNQSSDIDVIRLQETNFDNAATNFTTSSDGLLWQTIFGKDPINQNKIKTLMGNGLSREQAIAATIDDLASQQKEDPQVFRTNWIDKSIVEFNKLSPIEKEKNSLINDSYNLYIKSKRIFDNELTIKKRIDQETAKNLGEVGKQLSTMDIKPQRITYLDKSYELTKADIFDLAIYNKGRLAKLSAIVNPEEARTYEHESNNALQRLIQRGKGDLAEAFVEDIQNNTTSNDSPPFGIVDVYRGIKYKSERFGSKRDWSQVKKIQDIIDKKEYSEAMTKKADIIKESYGTKPNLKSGVLTGDTKVDNNILYNIKRWAGNYGTGNQNLSGDFNKFIDSLSDDLTKNNLEMSVIMDGNNNPQIEIVSYGEKGKRVGGMTIQPDEAAKLGINVNDIYESREVSSLRSKLNSNNNRTSAGDPSGLSTYLSGDSYYNKADFPNLSKSNKYDVQANIIFSNGKYYPYVFMTDGTKSTIEQLDGDPSLQKVVISLQNGITPGLIEQYLIEK